MDDGSTAPATAAARRAPRWASRGRTAPRARGYDWTTQATLVLIGNAVVMTAVWFALPRSWFFGWTGPTGYAVSLSIWMFGDVLSTNVLGDDPARALAALPDPAALRHLLRRRELVLWALVTPLCVAIALVVGTESDRWLYTVAAVTVVAIVPFGALPVCSLIGVLFPYHVRSLRWRWENRHATRRVVLRWLALALVPYWAYPLACLAILVGPKDLWTASVARHPSTGAAIVDCIVCVALTGAISAALWHLAHRVAVATIVGRRERLISYLSSPDLG